jgi:probable phosphoglycerate mutase
MPLFILVRHGENDYVKKGRLAGRLPGVHLNQKGREQAQYAAEALARLLKERPPKAIYSSPMERALETAEPIAKAFHVEVITREGLVETDCGEWTDKTLKSLGRMKLWRVVQSAPSRFCFPGGETFADAQARIRCEVESLAAAHDPKDVVVCVSHSDPIKLAIAYFIGLPLDLFQRLGVNPASINVLNVGESGSQLMALNIDASQCSASFSLPKP